MIIFDTLAGYSARLEEERRTGRTVGVVLTMGALHRGHAALIHRASGECDVVAVSIFVNPTQFAETSDLTSYPRTLDADVDMASLAGASIVLAPSVSEIYPGWPVRPATTVSVRGLAEQWEGRSRPGHFDGMATVVTKLLSASGQCRAYFGEKDFQQLTIVQSVVRDLSIPVDVVGCVTVREPDGLALSSRNARLDADQRAAALCLSRALHAGSTAVAGGAARSDVESAMVDVVAEEPLATLDYVALVDAVTLDQTDDASRPGPLRLLIAATVGGVRLIDNCDPLGSA